ncbi:putative F-box protein-like [Capsicum annuum]|nr:putative F-box protein-like [Capsicum annuum]KAF3618272.1 putative F-box protein-like [Capsicum annuum]
MGYMKSTLESEAKHLIQVCRKDYGINKGDTQDHKESEAFGQCNVLRLVVRNSGDDLHAPELEIYTLGDDEKWRNMGQVSCHLWYHFGNVNVNGSLHWIDGENLMSLASISSFNIGTEEVNPLLAPPGLKTTSFGLTLVELGNCLYFSENCTSH